MRDPWPLVWVVVYVILLAIAVTLPILAFYPAEPLQKKLIKSMEQTTEAKTMATLWETASYRGDFLLKLALMRNDIHKKQIADLLAVNDGLRTIIQGDPKLKRLLEVRE